MADKNQFTNNAKERLGTLQKEEQEISKQLREKEKEIRILLAQLHAIRDLVEEAGKEVSDNKYNQAIEEVEQQRKAQEKAIQNLEEVIDTSAKALAINEEEIEQSSIYTAMTTQKLKLATRTKSIEKLYQLAYTSNSWTDEESKDFFAIRDAITTSKNYDLADVLKQNIDQTYKALQFVATQKGDDIQRTYNAEYAMSNPIAKSINSPYPTFEPVKIKDDYKPTNANVKINL